MFGVSGASATMRVAFAALGKQALKKLPQKALTKSWYFAITKAIVKVFGIRLTKSTFAKGVSKHGNQFSRISSVGLFKRQKI